MEQVKWNSSSPLDGWQIKDNKGNKQRTQTQENGSCKELFEISMKRLRDVYCDPHLRYIILMHNRIYIVHLSLEGLKRTFSYSLLLQIGPCSQWKCN